MWTQDLKFEMREIKEGAVSKQEETTGSTHIIKIFPRASDDEMTRNGRKNEYK